MTNPHDNRRQLMADTLETLPEWARRHMVLVGIRGSHAHGTWLPPEHEYGTDDVDVFVVTAQEPDWYLGLESYDRPTKPRQHFETSGQDLDVVVYDIRKFGYLLLKGNPNVHNWLWAPEDCYLSVGVGGDWLLKGRKAFMSVRLLKNTAGYAAHQLHKMSHFQRNGYMGRKRKELVSRHGYDVKNAAHCVRLLLTGRELAETGLVRVRLRPEQREEIMEIKRGKKTLAAVKDRAEDLFYQFNQRREATVLCAEPDHAEAHRLIVRVINQTP